MWHNKKPPPDNSGGKGDTGMNRKELGEIRRRIKPEGSSITHIYGCYVNGNREIISYIDESLGLLTREETEKYLALLKNTLSGALGKNLLDLSFATKQVMDSDEHRLLSALRKSELGDAELREAFFKCVIDALDLEDSNYLILLAHDAYDVPHRGKDGLREDTGEVFKYILCCVCPVKTGKSELGYCPEEKRFHRAEASQTVAAPELGFMFPSFDERSANIYNALFYSRNTSEIHQGFIDAVFRTQAPMSAGRQRESFGEALGEATEKGCSFQVVQAVHEQLRERIEQHRESRDPEPLTVSPGELDSVLESSGLTPGQIDAFHTKCAAEFGEDARLSPANIIDSRRLEIDTPEVRVTVDPKYGYLVQTRVIDGKKYILIAADSGVEVNGIGVTIDE